MRLKDVARVELGARSHDVTNRFDDKSTVGLAIFVLPDCNALETGDAVRLTGAGARSLTADRVAGAEVLVWESAAEVAGA